MDQKQLEALLGEELKVAKVKSFLMLNLRNLLILIFTGFLLHFASDLIFAAVVKTDDWRITDPMSLHDRFFYEYCFMLGLVYAASIIFWFLWFLGWLALARLLPHDQCAWILGKLKPTTLPEIFAVFLIIFVMFHYVKIPTPQGYPPVFRNTSTAGSADSKIGSSRSLTSLFRSSRSSSSDRPPEYESLNVVVVLDVSYAMRRNFVDGNKFKAATSAIAELADKLARGDRLAVILTNRVNPFLINQLLAKPLNLIEITDTGALKTRLQAFVPRLSGVADFEKALAMSLKQLASTGEVNASSENHIVVLTGDNMEQSSARPLDLSHLLSPKDAASQKPVYISFVGIDVDFVPDFRKRIAGLSKVGCFTVDSLNDLRKLLSR